MKKPFFVQITILFLLLCSSIYSQSFEDEMGKGMSEVGAKVRRDNIRKEMEDKGYFKNTMPIYDFVPPNGLVISFKR
jgi:hypothetical protein